MKKRNKILAILSLALGILFVILRGINALPPVRIRAQLQLGNKYLDALRYDDAQLAFLNVLSVDEKNVPARLGLADVYLAQATEAREVGEEDETIDAYIDNAAFVVDEAEMLINSEQPDDETLIELIRTQIEKIETKREDEEILRIDWDAANENRWGITLADLSGTELAPLNADLRDKKISLIAKDESLDVFMYTVDTEKDGRIIFFRKGNKILPAQRLNGNVQRIEKYGYFSIMRVNDKEQVVFTFEPNSYYTFVEHEGFYLNPINQDYIYPEDWGTNFDSYFVGKWNAILPYVYAVFPVDISEIALSGFDITYRSSIVSSYELLLDINKVFIHESYEGEIRDEIEQGIFSFPVADKFQFSVSGYHPDPEMKNAWDYRYTTYSAAYTEEHGTTEFYIENGQLYANTPLCLLHLFQSDGKMFVNLKLKIDAISETKFEVTDAELISE